MGKKYTPRIPIIGQKGAQRLQIGMLFIAEKWVGNIFIERG